MRHYHLGLLKVKHFVHCIQVYFVHSFCALPTDENQHWALSVTDYGDQRFMSSIQTGNVFATQFHPEKSGKVGLGIIKSFLSRNGLISTTITQSRQIYSCPTTKLAKRVIACLDVRNNDSGDLIVTKGDQYDVRESSSEHSIGRGVVRNLGKPVSLCQRYFNDGADEVISISMYDLYNLFV